ncbi:MAG: N-acetylglucosaminyl-phosphatidylinositol de-N-acetylase family protein [Devosia sp.]|uniref:PIG-L deacetylase family protein n=1 Tax=Devosia sp. TaxID=1871048 RepID=UPI002622800F|nr:PIG-L deacetylase family protein [Devosia sp.]MDB5526931.1 N-acetylglucosaminyl-phosphatidylinositol de-N-acetylase family protein [Devosia sp.]
MTYRSALVVAAHPDDEVLGCGGLMAKLADAGTTVQVAFLADGVGAREVGQPDRDQLVERRAAANAACRILGAQAPSFGDFPDNRMDSVALLDIVKAVEALIDQHRPDLLLTHHAGDVNIDHRRLHEAVQSACRPQTGHPVRTLLFFEVASSTEWHTPGSSPVFAPNWFEDISRQLDRKLEALAAYERELRAWPHPRSLKGVTSLAHWRGATVGSEAAEAFILGRRLA